MLVLPSIEGSVLSRVNTTTSVALVVLCPRSLSPQWLATSKKFQRFSDTYITIERLSNMVVPLRPAPETKLLELFIEPYRGRLRSGIVP
jgi:hypothetical protein